MGVAAATGAVGVAVVGVAAAAWLCCCWLRGVRSTGIDCRDAPKEARGGLDSFTEDSTADSRDEVESLSSITCTEMCDVDMKFKYCNS